MENKMKVSAFDQNAGRKTKKNRPFHPIYKKGRLTVFAQKEEEGIRFFIENGTLEDLPQGLYVRLSISNYAVEISRP